MNFGDIIKVAAPIMGGVVGGPAGAALGAAAGNIWGDALFPKDDGSREARERADAANAANYNTQKEFAQHGIRWKVEDAKRAGIHPLYALGTQGPSFSPSTVVAQSESSPSYNMSQMGQDIGRSIHATRTGDERASAVYQALQLEKSSLENDLLRSQLARMNQQVNPPLPSNSGLSPSMVDSYVVEKPAQRTHSATGRPHEQAGQIADVGFARTSTGLTPVPSSDVKERIEDQFVPEMAWAVRNQLLPNIGSGHSAPSVKDHPIPQSMYPGANSWRWHILGQEWRPFNKDRGHFVPQKGGY